MINLLKRRGMIELLCSDEVPAWFKYSARFRSVVNQGLVDFHPWHMLPRENAVLRLKWITAELPGMQLVPFASRLDCGLEACFEKDNAGVVQIVADERPYRVHQVFPSFEDWIRAAIEDTLSFEVDGHVWTPPE